MDKNFKLKIEKFFDNCLKEGIYSAKLNTDHYMILFDIKSGVKFYLTEEGTQKISGTKGTQKLKQTNGTDAWKRTVEINSISGFDKFIEAHPKSTFIDEAKEKRDQVLKDQEAWESAKKVDAVNSYRKYMKNFPDGAFIKEAQESISSLKKSELPEEPHSFYKFNKEKAGNLKPILLTALTMVVIGIIGYFIFFSGRQDKEIPISKDIKENIQPVLRTEETETNNKEVGKDLKFKNYLELAKKYLKDEDYDKVLEELESATGIKISPDLTNLLKDVESAKVEAIKLEKQFNGFLKSAEKLFKNKQFDKSLEQIKLAKNIKINKDTQDLEENVKNAQKESLKKKQRMDESEIRFKSYMAAARGCYVGKKYEEGLYQINLARKIKVNQELISLAKNLKNAQKKEKERIKKAKEDKKKEKVNLQPQPKKVVVQRVAKEVSIFYLDKGIKEEYRKLTKRMIIPGFDSNLKINGQLKVVLKVDHRGIPSIVAFDTAGLKISQDNKRSEIEKKIKSEFYKIPFSPPTNSSGEPVILKNWRLLYTVGTFRGNVNLNITF